MSHSTGGAFPNLSTFGAIRSPPERCLHGDIAFQVIRVDIPPKPIVRVLRVILSFNNVRLGQTNRRTGSLRGFKLFPIPRSVSKQKAIPQPVAGVVGDVV